MKTKLISVLALIVAMPAIAETSNTESTFPVPPAQMQADTTYTGAATYANLHSYTGPVAATANYIDNNYTVNAGQYLPSGGEAVTTCTAGNFCPGLQSPVQYSETLNQGLESCPNGYPNSAAGATANTECYTVCTVANANIAHASTVSGNDYYGAGTDTCVPTACDNGYHLNSGAPNLTETIGVTGGGTAFGSINHSGTYSAEGSTSQATYGISAPDTFGLDYGSTKGRITGRALCSTQVGDNQDGAYTNPTTNATMTPEFDTQGAEYCYCTIDSYTSPEGASQSLSAPWVFNNTYGSASVCASDCASGCAGTLLYDFGAGLAFRAAVFNSIPSGAPSCEANTIQITWGDTDAADVTANDAGQCTFGGDIRTPVKAVHKKGKTFVGWTFDVSSGD